METKAPGKDNFGDTRMVLETLHNTSKGWSAKRPWNAMGPEDKNATSVLAQQLQLAQACGQEHIQKEVIDNILAKVNAPPRRPLNILPDNRPKPKPKEFTKDDNTRTPSVKEPNLWLGPKLPDWKNVTPDDPCNKGLWPDQRPAQDQGGVCSITKRMVAGKEQGGVCPINKEMVSGKLCSPPALQESEMVIQQWAFTLQDQGGVCPITKGIVAGKDQGGVCPIPKGMVAGKDQGGVCPITKGTVGGKEGGSSNPDLYWKRCHVSPEHANLSTHDRDAVVGMLNDLSKLRSDLFGGACTTGYCSASSGRTYMLKGVDPRVDPAPANERRLKLLMNKIARGIPQYDPMGENKKLGPPFHLPKCIPFTTAR
ncbi:hypothetical protein NDU88_006557 [Pleurodeles waltl]|uniref:Uncharacterized protein n=1 Tax=Pleurodeles waltl TaxID=8319 RepID=A0AAV7WEU7_PLEWA|nr:hypothetical protein NDU88_006557 [Pleurodeles waltl]